MSSILTGTPRELGYRMPAEWEPHEATWLGFPHNTSDWPGRFHPIPWVYSEFARKICPGEIVRLLVQSMKHRKLAERIFQRAGVYLQKIEFVHIETDRGWTRDFGPIFVKNDAGELAIVDFAFNGWANIRIMNWITGRGEGSPAV